MRCWNLKYIFSPSKTAEIAVSWNLHTRKAHGDRLRSWIPSHLHNHRQNPENPENPESCACPWIPGGVQGSWMWVGHTWGSGTCPCPWHGWDERSFKIPPIPFHDFMALPCRPGWPQLPDLLSPRAVVSQPRAASQPQDAGGAPGIGDLCCCVSTSVTQTLTKPQALPLPHLAPVHCGF